MIKTIEVNGLEYEISRHGKNQDDIILMAPNPETNDVLFEDLWDIHKRIAKALFPRYEGEPLEEEAWYLIHEYVKRNFSEGTLISND